MMCLDDGIAVNECGVFQMCAWDKSYHGLAYPKVIVDARDMPSAERTFYERLIDSINSKIDIDDLVVEQRNGAYRTVVYGHWDYDFLRYHLGDDGFWVSVRMSREMAREYAESPYFTAQENKRQSHWRSSVKPDEIGQLGDVIAKSAVYFLERITGKPDAQKRSAASLATSFEGLGRTPRVLPETVVEDLETAWEESCGSKQALKPLLEQNGYALFTTREITLAFTKGYTASARLTIGAVLECKLDEGNAYDDKAIGVFVKGGPQVGYLPNSDTKLTVYKALKSGEEIAAIVSSISAGNKSRQGRKRILLISIEG